MSRYSFAFIRGVFIGCAVSALLLIASDLVYRGVSLSLETVYGRETDSLAPAEGRSLLLYESQASRSVAAIEDNHPVFTQGIIGENVKDVKSNNEEEILLLQQPRKPLLIVVVTSEKLLERTSGRIRRTWGKETADYRIVVGKQNIKTSNIPNLLSTSHPGLPAFPYLSIGDLNFLLNLVRSEFLGQYSWFIFMSSNTYVSVQSLERFLGGMDASEVVYMGSPSNNSVPRDLRYCEGGPGLIFSHAALRGMKEPCSGRSGGDGYGLLGRCIASQLRTDCYRGVNVPLQQYFLYDRNVTSLRVDQMWKKSAFKSFLTLYPVRDQHHIDILHSFSQAREIATKLRRVAEIEDMLRMHHHCLELPESCNITTNVSHSGYTYANFSRSCNYLHQGYVAEVRRKVTNWDSMTGHTIYNSWDLDPQALVHGDLGKELKYMTGAAMELVKREMPDATLENVAMLYVRYKGTTGREFIFDMELNRTKGERLEKRISLLLPHQTQVLLDKPQVFTKNLTQINFIIPLKGLDRKKVAKFQRTYYSLCVRRAENCKLVYVIFGTSTTDINFMRTYLVRFKRRHSKFVYDYVVGDGKFDLTKAYLLGVSRLKDSDLVFIATADLSLADHFLTRCRNNPVRGARIYYPEVFTYYNIPYVYRGKWHPRNYDYSRMHGHWATHAVGCLYMSDFLAIDGYRAFKQWEFEPVTTLGGSLEVMRAPDPGISYWYEATKCDSSLPPNHFSNCLSRQSDNLADRLSLAGYLLALEERCSERRTT